MRVHHDQIVRYCAQECAWQQSGELSVANMYDAWRKLYSRRGNPLTFNLVELLGFIVEPKKNSRGIRTQPVWVGSYDNPKMGHELIRPALEALIRNRPPVGCSDENATEWFRVYEEIHPFIDGNGRTGSLLYNYLLGTLAEPIHAPNLWADGRREVPGYPHVMEIRS